MIAALLAIFYAFGFIVFLLGLQGLIFFPLTVVYEIWKQRALRRIPRFDRKISVLVPAYNEEKTIRSAVQSIISSEYRDKEIIIINDGSTDNTEESIRDFIDAGTVIYIKKHNGGKASALNMGMEAATGEVILYTDADSLFEEQTISGMVRWFGNPSVDAVCGNDAPLNPSTPIQRFLTITTHIGTGFVRRALSVIGCLPVITGNLGAVRASVLRELKGFRDIWGEDLELSFRLHKMRKRIIFDPAPRVLAECPGTISSLWKQRIRWMRSYIKVASLHRDLFFSPKFRPFSFYLPLNFMNMAIIPLIQIGLLILIPFAIAARRVQLTGAVEVMSYFGIIFFFAVAIYSILLDRGFSDLKYLPYGLLIVPFSYFYNAVMAFSWWKEILRAEEKWEKIERRELVQQGNRKLKAWKIALAGILLVILSSSATYFIASRHNKQDFQAYNHNATKSHRLDSMPVFHLALSTHFDAWEDWEDTLGSVIKRPYIGLADVVGIGAGRPEWVYFRWQGHEKDWANHQKSAKTDLLYRAADTFHRAGFKTAAIIDLYAPEFIKTHPEAAALKFDGERSSEQVSLMELAAGDYGKKVLEMIEFIAGNYPADIINLTELSYYSYSFNSRDLKSYKAYSGRQGWPMDDKGRIDKEDPSVWEWKSAMMEGFIRKAADSTHKYKKELYVDVPVSWKNFNRNGMDSGLDYKLVLKHADKIIVWDYFDVQDFKPGISQTLAEHLGSNFPMDKFYISIGLWGRKNNVSPEALSEAVAAALKGGALHIWITPNHMITDKHWEKILANLKSKRPGFSEEPADK